VIGRKADIVAIFLLQITTFLITWMILERMSIHERTEEW